MFRLTHTQVDFFVSHYEKPLPGASIVADCPGIEQRFVAAGGRRFPVRTGDEVWLHYAKSLTYIHLKDLTPPQPHAATGTAAGRHPICPAVCPVTLMSSSVAQYTNETQAPVERLDPRLEMTGDGPLLMIDALARAMAARDESTAHHARRVQRFALALAGEVCLGDTRMIDAIDAAALVHDIGKLGIADRLLQKPGPLTADEYERVKQHAVIGADILTAVALPGLAVIVRHHHENWDGTGYPDGLCGETIPLGARVLSIVDCYDALTSDRPYRRALSHACALTMIRERRGTMYDPAIVDAFLHIVQRLQRVAGRERGGSLQVRARAAWAKRAGRIRRVAQDEARGV